MEEMVMAKFKVLSQHSSGGTDKQKEESQVKWHPNQAAYQALPGCESFVTTGGQTCAVQDSTTCFSYN
jgi:hypothetical protein